MTHDHESAADAGVDARSELERLNALPLDERAGGLAETVRRLEAELDATEATERAGATRTGPAGN
jgi:uncharacterized small protein (DUF1192 family)